MSESTTTYLVIGGGLAARDAVKSLRKKDADASITMVSDERHLPYDRPPLTKEFLQGDKSREDIFLETASFYEEHAITTLLGQRVTTLDPDAHRVSLHNGDTLVYEKALIATGGRPVTLPLPGAELTGVYYLRTLDDGEAIRNAAGPGVNVAIIGGGFIGLELAASLTKHGCHVSVIEAGPHIWARFADEELAGVFQRYLSQKGVTFHTGQTVKSVNGAGKASSVTLADGKELHVDLVCIGIGIKPNVEFAQAAGLTVNNGLVVDEQLRTSHPDIYGAGDVINYPDKLFGKRRRVEHWSHASFSGRLAGMNMAGDAKTYDFLSFVWSDIFDLHLKFVGDHSDYDELIQRGSTEGESFAILYVRDGILTACFTVNGDPREFTYLKMLVQKGFRVGAHREELANPQCELKALAMAK